MAGDGAAEKAKAMELAKKTASVAMVTSGLGGATAATAAAAGKVSVPMLTRTNYAAWALRMKYIMRVHGVWGAVDPESSAAEADGSKEEMAMTIISQGIDDETLLRVAEKETAAEVWAALRSMHVGAERVREARIQSLRSDFDALKMSCAESVDDFAAKFTTLVGRIRELGDPMEEKYVVKKLLRARKKELREAALSQVRRFIVKDTVEERMQQAQVRKQRMISGALTDEVVRSSRIEQLKMLSN
uniref:Uncharacterized protein n=1 Tax=Avena sativa TaxID=4498 RepID=A0ACD5UVV1_AVESA